MAGKPRDVEVTFDTQEDLGASLHVLSFSADEAMNQLFRVDLNLAADSSKTIDFSLVVGKDAVLTLTNDQGTRHFNGIISRIQQHRINRNWTEYSATLVPRAWRLQHRKDSRIFQKKTLQQIVEEVLKPGKVEHQFRLKGNKKPPKRTYCVQYRESDWSFVRRLLEEEGFHFYFEHSATKHLMHICNEATYHPAISGSSASLNYHLASTAPAEEAIFALSYEERVRSGKAALGDFTFLKPSMDQKKDKAADDEADLEMYDYPGLYPFAEEEEKGDSQELQRKEQHTDDMANMRLQVFQAQRKVANGQSDCLRFTAGFAFELDKYDRSEMNQKEYLLLQVAHRGEKHADLEGGAVSKRIRYSNNFTIMPKAVPYRPPRLTPKPIVQGSQTAIVVGPGSDEIYTDKHGRVKVQFHWDRHGKRDSKSSCWVRVSQLWAGQSWGAMYIPRIGQEVIVDFLEGDPDRPIIIGRVYHASNPPPYTLPEHKTKSTIKSNSSIGGDGYNEICFEDKKSQEQIITHAQRDQNETVLRNLSTTVGNDHTLTVGGKQTRTIKKDRTTTITEGNDSLTVTLGTQTETVKGNTSHTVQAGSRAVDVTGGNYTLGVHGGDIIGTASGGVGLTGEAGGVSVAGTGGTGVLLEGDGTTGVQLEGTPYVYAHAPTVEINGDDQAALLSKVTIVQGDTTLDVNGTAVTITGIEKVTITAGPNSMVMDPSGITVIGSLVKIN